MFHNAHDYSARFLLRGKEVGCQWNVAVEEEAIGRRTIWSYQEQKARLYFFKRIKTCS